MARYTILNSGKDGATERFEIEADDDEEALALFALRLERSNCELWLGDRRIKTGFDAEPEQGQPAGLGRCAAISNNR
jgi:hypothetical protein